MPQLFRPAANSIFPTLLVAVPLVAGLVWLAAWRWSASSWFTGQDVPLPQPVPFSHKHHVGDDGIDCRYCHDGVERSSFAGMPATNVCMTCHSQLFADSPMLAPVRESVRTRMPLAWNRVNDVPDFVYFDHSIHVNKGVGCVSCHGRVDRMPLTYQARRMSMGWCLGCHRNPAPHLRPPEAVFDMAWEPPADERQELQRYLVERYRIQPAERLTECVTCHR